MDEKLIDRVTQILIDRFNYLGIDEFNLAVELNRQTDPVTGRLLTQQEKSEIEKKVLCAINYRKSHDGAILIPVSIVTDPRGHEEWYDDWYADSNNEENSYYWKRLEHHLGNELTRKYGPYDAGIIVKSIDETTHGIIRKTANPARTEFSYKGLVVGYVQSGKTANFSALIAKAVDAGYKFIVVLAGIYDVLRLQTQIRLDKELTGMNDLGIDEPFISQPSDAKSWNRLTTANNDFRIENLDPFSAYCRRSTPSIAIIKKNCSVMGNLIAYISQASEAERHRMPIMVIDDEADQASIDTNANYDTEPSRTNEKIRTLLSYFPKKIYVGYTATPFANILVDMTAEHEHLEDDIYPRNFIASLPEPKGYFGTSAIFEGVLSDCFVMQVPEERNVLINGQITDAMMRAIDEFIICCAVRNLRNERQKPMSMLIHVSHKINEMKIIRELVQGYYKILLAKYNDNDGRNILKKEYNELWHEFQKNAETINKELSLNNKLPTFDGIWDEIDDVLKSISIVELNSSSEDTLDYTTGKEIKVIAIGGNQLSRGLTLEGLMTSYYLRDSKQYDTLLQMARWFGYRKGYEDLMRVHTTQRIWESFEHLALVEEEMRSEIYRYEEDNCTPAEMALAIRAHKRLKVTAKNKMGAGGLKQVSFSESLNQTICFPLDKPDILNSNYDLGDKFIRKIKENTNFEAKDGTYLARNVDGEIILAEFLNKYRYADRESTDKRGLDSERLLEYIYRRINYQNPELTKWNVAMVSSKNPIINSDDPLAYGGLKINRIERSRKYTYVGYNIGVLTEPDHLTIDLRVGAKDQYDGRSPQNPLLLLYLIWHQSKARKRKESPQLYERIDLYRFISSEKIDVLGLAIVLPKSDYEPYDYIGQ
jgi:hypothetical protein